MSGGGSGGGVRTMGSGRWRAQRTLRDSTNLIGFEYRYLDNATLFDDTRNSSPLLTSGLGGIRPTSAIFFNLVASLSNSLNRADSKSIFEKE